jgi:deoxyadenosine/deoxycytidine kinase
MAQQLHGIRAADRVRPNPKAIFLIVEGEIGAGKTVLISAIAAALRKVGLNVCLVLEPVQQWSDVGILDKFYDNRDRFAYGFQTFVYATRIMAIEEAITKDGGCADVYLFERSPATDEIFMELQRDLVDPVEMTMYSTWCKSFRTMLTIDISKAKILYLKTSLPHCMGRVEERARVGELAKSVETTETGTESEAKSVPKRKKGVSIEYQTMLRRAHEAFLQDKGRDQFPLMPKSPFPLESVIEIGPEFADCNFRDPGPEQDRIVAAILQKAIPGLAKMSKNKALNCHGACSGIPASAH